MAEEQSSSDQELKDIRSLVWKNKLPVKIVLDPEQNSNNEVSFPLYMFMQRVHLPIFYYEKIHDYFEKFAPVPRNHFDIWLEMNNKPIIWNIPFGVTFDLNTDDSTICQLEDNDDSFLGELGNSKPSSPFYPVTIILHYGPCNLSSEYLPIPQIPGKTLSEMALQNFRFTIKESLFVRNDNDQPLALLDVQDQNKLWNSYIQHDQETFFKIFDQLFTMKYHLQNNKDIKMPIRVYIEDYVGRISLTYRIETGNEVLGDLLAKYFPKIVTQTETKYQIINDKYSDLKVLCNGITCDFNMPLLFFYKYFFHYDGFIYICIKK